ncbi:ankyrin repeat domain-containing protein [Persicirhabdus sediminis]|uniref:Ankyrin repeat domain-containing protein n=1 Tax=Persicirhabdus sediminis TaxID=454144 RepID=A0A8J7MBK1_9BACT|nr:ankyrin repeat domain-containing protein [Persicirhabdus sediminis]MBK1790028.1 ankyrin repeat domain-containing protein [Persicirhabdus sediminis]
MQKMKHTSAIILLVLIVVMIALQSQCEKAATTAPETVTQMTAGDRFWLFREACRTGDETGVRILLRLGADVDGINDYKEFYEAGYVEDTGWGVEPSWPINQAAWNGHTNIVNILIEEGAMVDNMEGEGNTALINAAFKGHLEIVTILLEAGANPHLKGVNGWKPVDAAKAASHEEIYLLLRELTKSSNEEIPEYGTSWQTSNMNAHNKRPIPTHRGCK